MIQRDPPNRECGSRGMRCVLRAPASWSGLGGQCIHTRHFSVRMGHRQAFRRHISNDRKCRLITKLSVQTIFRFLVLGKGSVVSWERDKYSPAVQTCFSALQRRGVGRTRLRTIQAHGWKVRTNIRVGSEELEAMVASGDLYGLCEKAGSLSERGSGEKGTNLQKLTALYLLSSSNARLIILIKSAPSSGC